MSEHKEPIPSRIYNAAVGGHVCGTDDIIDDGKNKTQTEINTELEEQINNSSDFIKLLNLTDTAPAQCAVGDKYYNTNSKKIFTATAINTWGNTGVDPDTSRLYVNLSNNNIYRWNGTDMTPLGNPDVYTKGEVNGLIATERQRAQGVEDSKQNILVAGTNMDTTPTSGSNNPITSGGVKTYVDNKTDAQDTVIANAIAAQDAEIDSRMDQQDAIISTLNGQDTIVVPSVPASGVANKIYRVYGTTSYSDYMFNADALTTPIKIAEYSFPGIDNTPTEGSQKLVSSGGVYEAIMYGGFEVDVEDYEEGTIRTNGTDWDTTGYKRTDYIRIDPKKKVKAIGNSSNNATAFIAFYTVKKVFISSVSNIGTDGVEYAVDAPENAVYCRATSKDSTVSNPYVKQDPYNIEDVSEDVAEIKENLDPVNIVNLVKTYNNVCLNKGKLRSSTFHIITDFIPVDENKAYYFSGKLASNTIGDNIIACYSTNSNDAYLGGIEYEGTITSYDGNYTLPQDTKYVRLCGRINTDIYDLSTYIFNVDLQSLALMIQPISENLINNSVSDLLLPTYFDIAANLQCDFFIGDAIVNKGNRPLLISLPEAKNLGGEHHHARINAEAGNYTLTVATFLDKAYDRIIGTKSTTVRCNARTGGSGTKNVLIIGDSLVEYGPICPEMCRLLELDGDVTINSIGTQSQVYEGNTYHHEGYAGKTWAFFTGDESPFYINGRISFADYMAQHFSSQSLDCIFILLGSNDTFASIESSSKALIDYILADYPNCKIAVGLIAKGSSTSVFDDNINNVYYKNFEGKAEVVNRLYLDLYDNGIYNPNVTCVAQGIWIDRDNDYPYDDLPTTPYNENNTVRVFKNAIHPSATGYKQWGRALYCKMRAWIAGNL